ncbi:hypothetical protein [Lewinella sp. 4G2]|uniref:hypothetical protein n=1 Tax=Lewinella sp. 4G2 TaxID=1803372 RepID=UPI0007B47666|nr:hypothetical protein [Lewinella sp. 4G2]OAV44108.1 hypothetical protein A3850_006165 [Lewinella sp. 4G2]
MLKKHILLPALLSCGLGFALFSCGGSDSAEGSWDEPTTGLITTVKEVNAGEFKIASEEEVPAVADSRIIVQELNGNVDTLTLEEAKIIETSNDTTSRRRGVRSARSGYFGWIMMGRMMGGSPSSSAYVNNNAYNRASSGAGTKMKSTARRVGGTSRNSGFGSGKSTRSVGG